MDFGGHFGLDVVAAVGGGDGGGEEWVGGGGDGDVVFGDGEAARGVVAAPAGARQVDLGPGVEVAFAFAAVGILIAADEAGGEADAAAGVDE